MPTFAQSGQADTRGIKPTVYRDGLAVDVTGFTAAQKGHCVGYLLCAAIAVHGDRVVIVFEDGLAVNQFGHFCGHRPRRDTVHTDACISQFCCLLFGQVDDGRFAGAVGHPQGAGSQARDRGDVDDTATPVFEHDFGARLRAPKGTVQIGVHNVSPILPSHFQYWFENGDARVVDE